MPLKSPRCWPPAAFARTCCVVGPGTRRGGNVFWSVESPNKMTMGGLACIRVSFHHGRGSREEPNVGANFAMSNYEFYSFLLGD